MSKKVKEAILDVLGLFKDNPAIIHSESDIQALLHAKLLEKFPELVATQNTLQEVPLKTYRVHCEYKGTDIVVFSEEGVKSVCHLNGLLYANNKTGLIECDALIEIKFENGKRAQQGKVRNDFIKLREQQQKYYNQHGKKPDLYLLFLIFYYSEVQINNMLKSFLQEVPSIANDGAIVHTYIAIGPKDIWKPIIERFDVNYANVNLDFTI